MREILFRGKDVNSNEWRIGYFYTAVQGCVAIIGDGVDGYQVKHETVGQYTGLTDKNGTRVFEGDIVKYTEIDIDGSDDKYIGVIYYNQSKANYVIQKRKYMVNFVTSWIGDVEVIGNIHDNPDFLEVKQ